MSGELSLDAPPTRSEVCAVAVADAFADDGEIFGSPMGLMPMLGVRLAKLTSNPDLLISDYRLARGETGFDVISIARCAYGDQLPAVIITGDTDPKLIRSMADRGAIVQHKPLDIDSLLLTIARVTERRAAGR